MDYAAAILAKIPGTSTKLDRGLKQFVESLETYMPPEVAEALKKSGQWRGGEAAQ